MVNGEKIHNYWVIFRVILQEQSELTSECCCNIVCETDGKSFTKIETRHKFLTSFDVEKETQLNPVKQKVVQGGQQAESETGLSLKLENPCGKDGKKSPRSSI